MMSSEADLYQRLTEIFRDVFSRDDIMLRPDLTAQDITGWDSFRQVEILMAVQEVFKVKFSTREMDGLANVGDLVKVIASKVPAAQFGHGQSLIPCLPVITLSHRRVIRTGS